MRKVFPLLLLSLFSLILQAQRFPERPTPPRLVNDFANMISQAEEQRLEQKLTRYADTTSTQITVVTIQSLGGEDPNLYAAEMGQKWGVGQKDKENGLVMLISKEDRKMAIQNGYGLEATLTNAKTKRIIENYLLPSFRKGNFYQGINKGTDQVIKLLAGKFEGQPGNKTKRKGLLQYLPFALLIILFFYFLRKRKGGSGHDGHGGYRSSGGGLWLGGMMMGSAMGGGMGGSGGGGGFGGFGGGAFGGGGASGGW